MEHRKYRVKTGNYYHIYKPYFKDSYSNGRVTEHRYIMYLYLSILNNKITYIPKNMHIHHKNKNGLDNRPENLELLDHRTHRNNHNIQSLDRICNLCKCKTKYDLKGWKRWCNDINGFLCRDCYIMIYNYRKKWILNKVLTSR